MKVVVTAAAESDLERIGDYIAERNPARAVGFVRELRDACIGIGAAPHAYPIVPRLEPHGVRRRVHGNYLIFYRLRDQAVQIMHVLHGAMDYERILFPE
jgi:plasmid stabilization system protein ParE